MKAEISSRFTFFASELGSMKPKVYISKEIVLTAYHGNLFWGPHQFESLQRGTSRLFASFCFPPFSSIEFQTHPTTGPLWSFEDLPLLSPTWAPKWKILPGRTGCGVWAPRHCPNDFANVTHIKSGSWPGKNETSAAVEEEHEKVVTRTEWQPDPDPKSKVSTLGKQKSLHSSDFTHHVHTSHQAFILGQALSIRLSRVQPRCIEPWACGFIAKKGRLMRNVSRKEMVLGENRTLNFIVFESDNIKPDYENNFKKYHLEKLKLRYPKWGQEVFQTLDAVSYFQNLRKRRKEQRVIYVCWKDDSDKCKRCSCFCFGTYLLIYIYIFAQDFFSHPLQY